MEYFSTILIAFVVVTLLLSRFSSVLQGVTGCLAVFVSFCSLIYVQRIHVREEKEQEQANIKYALQQLQKAQSAEKKKMQKWYQDEVKRVYKGRSDPSAEKFIQYSNLFGITANFVNFAVPVLNSMSTKKRRLLQHFRKKNGANMRQMELKLDTKYTYNSNAIEGNQISLAETELILYGLHLGRGPNKTTTRSAKPEDVEDIIGHSEAFRYVRDLFSSSNNNATTFEIDEDVVLTVHKLVMRSDIEQAGRYRREEYASVGNNNRKVLFAMPDEVPALMKRLIGWIKSNSSIHPFLLATNVHYMLVRIHPFVDGNGRTARLISNLILMLHGYPPIIVPVERKREYLGSLAAWDDDGDPIPFTKLMAELLHEMFEWSQNQLSV